MSPTPQGARRRVRLAAAAIVAVVLVAGCAKGGTSDDKSDGSVKVSDTPVAANGEAASSGDAPTSTRGVTHGYEPLSSLKGESKTIAVVDACGTCGGDARMNKALTAV